MKRLTSTLGAAPILALSLLIPSPGQAIDRTVNCTAGQTIGNVLRSLSNGDIVKVIGNCNENVSITEVRPTSITLDGGGSATITGPDATSPVIQISGTRAIIQNFANITGGRNGIQLNRGASATIDNNTIQGVGNNGILIRENSSAVILNSTIQNNANGSGIIITDSATARIGFSNAQDTIASPNTITGNGTTSGNNGITVTSGSFAQIVGNTINGNGLGGGTPSGHGVSVTQASAAEISDNEVNGNAQDGISVGRNSFVQLGSDSGTGIFDNINRSSTSNNGRVGLRCFINSSADGRLGTLNGNTSPFTKEILSGCVDSLL